MRWRFRGIGVCRNIQRTAAGKFNCAKRAGDATQFAAYAQAFIQLHGTINTSDGVNRADRCAGCIFTVVTELRRRFFSFSITLRRGIDCRPCWRCVSEQVASQVWQPIQSVESAITKRFTRHSSGDCHFDENMPMKCHFRHSSTRPSPNRRNACKTGKASAHAAGLCPFTSWLKFTAHCFQWRCISCRKRQRFFRDSVPEPVRDRGC